MVELRSKTPRPVAPAPNTSNIRTFEIGCHAEGHYEAGMKGTFVVK
jgi:hypothetical protein